MSKKLEDKISLLENKVKQLENEHKDIFENLRLRDYLIKSNFIGSLTNKSLIEEFQTDDLLYSEYKRTRLEEFWQPFHHCKADVFVRLTAFILEYDFRCMEVFICLLRQYEKKQDTIKQYSDCKDNKKGETEK